MLLTTEPFLNPLSYKQTNKHPKLLELKYKIFLFYADSNAGFPEVCYPNPDFT